jgi:hypothetical protein
MDSRARRERNRRRLPRRSAASRWTRRIAGLLATAAFLGVGAVSAQMIIPDANEEVVAATPTPTPTATPKGKQTTKPKAKKPKPLTKAQKAARQDAVAVVRAQGDTTIKATDYDPRAKLRVLLGRPVGDSAGGLTAYFFTKDGLIGKDAPSRSTRLSVARKGKVTVTLSYGVYRLGDNPGDPSGRKRERFRLEGTVLTPLDTVPTQTERFQRRNS